MREPNRLLELVDVGATAEWRRDKAAQYPEDERNERAAELLERLTAEINALNWSPLHLRIETFVNDGEISGEINFILKSIGFRYVPATGEQLLRDIVAQLEHRCKSEGPGFKLV
jgi:SLT domain-containing protein